MVCRSHHHYLSEYVVLASGDVSQHVFDAGQHECGWVQSHELELSR
jgi:hypothetical protein